jgi:hypothetical protein
MKNFAFLLLLVACLAATMTAQEVTGTIGGTILDPSGAAVPNAKIALTNLERNQVIRNVTTDASGVYAAPFLPVGTYSVKAEAAGFKMESRTGIVLNVNDVLKINLTMQVGAMTETVEVTADAAQVELGSPASSSTIDSAQVHELALATRNYEQLMVLMPGVISNATDELYIGNSLPGGTAATIPYSVNGARSSSNNWTVDGADNVDRGSNLTLSTFPSVDAIAQFKVQRASYTADSGRAGGAQVNVVTKGGSSQFHGNLYEYFRNDVLNANNWGNNANKSNLVNGKDPNVPCTAANYTDCYAKIAPYRQNDFGFTIGGPVPIGRKNQTFFFYSQEWHRVINYSTFNPTIPTQGMLAGNFSQPVCVQFSGTTCSLTGTSIPSNQWNANSTAYIKDIFSKLPASGTNSVAATSAGFFPVRNVFNGRQEMGRIDHTFSERFSLYGRFTIDDIPTTEAGGLFSQSSVPNMAITQTNSPGRGVVIHSVNIIRPSIVNDAGFNFSQSAILTTPIGLSAKANSPDINPKEPFTNPEGVVPTVSFTGGSSGNGAGPYVDYNRNYAWFDNLTWIKGRHTVKFGVSVNRYQKTENANSGQGSFAFNNLGAPTGTNSFQQSWANFLLGNVSSFTQPSMDITPDVRTWQTEAYAQDDFKIAPRLTVYYGVRWSYFGQPIDANGIMDNFDPALYSAAKAPQINPANGTVIPGTVDWQVNGIIVGGKNSPFGGKIANDNYHNFAPRIGLAWDPFGNGKTSVRAGYGVYYDATLFGIYEQNQFANPPFVASVNYTNANFSDVSTGTAGISPLSPQATSVLALHATQLPAKVPYTQNWNLTIQHQIARGTVLELAYVGSKGTHLLGIIDLNEAYPGVALAAGLHAPNGNTVFTTADEPNVNAVKPFRGFAGISAVESGFDSNYHSVQVNLRKNFSNGGLIGAVYTFGKVLSDNSSDRSNAPQNSYNWHEGEYGRASWDRTQVLTINYVYNLPFFRQGRGLAHTALGGWEVSGIMSTYTGQPLTATTSSADPAGLGILSTGPASVRPDQICNPNTNAPHQYGANAQGALWFNTSCFAAVPQGVVRPGNAGRYTIQGPGFFNLDAAIFKNFNISKGERWKLQLRGESFNTMNWVNPSGIGSANNTSSLFGIVTGYRAPRRMQVGARITF